MERLAYLQDIGAPDPLKVVQMELGHAHMATTEAVPSPYRANAERGDRNPQQLRGSAVGRIIYAKRWRRKTMGDGGGGGFFRSTTLSNCELRTLPVGSGFRAGRRPSLLRKPGVSLSRPELARVLANSFWTIYQPSPRWATVKRTAEVLKLFDQFLNFRSSSQADAQTAGDLTTDLLEEFAVWLVGKHKLKRRTAANIFTVCCHFLRRGQRLYPDEFPPFFSTPKKLFPGADNDRTESRVLSLTDFQKILAAAEDDVQQVRDAYKPGDVPTSAQHLIPFMVIIAARTGINPRALYGLQRDCLSPHEFDENLFYCTWDKPRAGKQQRQLHRADRRNQMGVVELIQFLRQFTAPLASASDAPDHDQLFLYYQPEPRP